MLMRMQPDHTLSSEQIRDLWIAQIAQIRYLQDEFATLQVQGRFDKLDPSISSIFRSLQKQTSDFQDTHLDTLHKAIDIAGAASRHPASSSSQVQGGRFQGQRPRGGGNQSQWRGQQQRSDVYSQLASRNFSRRPNNAQQPYQQQGYNNAGTSD